VEKIALIDLPGLGDTQIGNQERMIKTIAEKADFVLFVRKPETTGSFWAEVDVRLYDLIKQSVTDIPVENWSSMVLNKVKHSEFVDNLENCEELKRNIHEKHIEVQYIIIADCSSPDEVKTKILDRVINYLSDTIIELDEQYCNTRQKELYSLQKIIDSELKNAIFALNSILIEEDDTYIFNKLLDELMDRLSAGLEQLLGEFRNKRNEVDKRFKNEFIDAINKCKMLTIPSQEIILNSHARLRAWEDTYNYCLNFLRTQITHYFERLGDALKKHIDEVKGKVARVFYIDGKIEKILKIQDETGSILIQNLFDEIPSPLITLKSAFKTLSKFELTYRGFIQYRIRRHLDELTPDSKNINVPNFNLPDVIKAFKNSSESENYSEIKSKDAASIIHELLQTAYSETIYNLESSLDDLLRDPNQVAFAIVEEFVDQVLSAQNARHEWNSFYRRFSSKVWPNSFEQMIKQSNDRKGWEKLLDQVNKANKKHLYRFTF